MNDIQEIFDTHNRISKAWLDKVLRSKSSVGQALTCVQKSAARHNGEGLGSFLKLAFETSSHLFSSNLKIQDEELMEISVVFLAWKRLRKMRASNERFSEADYVASVYVSPNRYSTLRRANIILTIISAIMFFGVLPSGTASSG